MMDMFINGENVEIIYLDFDKAYNKVDLGLLLTRLRDVGIKRKDRSMDQELHNEQKTMHKGQGLNLKVDVDNLRNSPGISIGKFVVPDIHLEPGVGHRGR